MNLTTMPKEALERLQNNQIARKLGPIHGWSEEQFYAVAAHTYHVPLREIQIKEVDASAFHAKQEFFIRAGQIPLKRYSDIIVVTECEPWDERKLQELIQEFELGVKRVLVSTRNYDHLLGQLTYRKPEEKKAATDTARVFFPNAAWDNVEEPRILLEIIRRSDLMGASDIHLEPGEGYMRVRFRVHGNLLVQRKLTARQGEEVMKSLKLEAHLLHSQTGTFQSSRIRTQLPHGKTIDLRVEVSPSVDGGDSVVMRLLDFQSINRSLDDLNLPPAYYPVLTDTISKTSGLIIVTGPTGSGKTTTLYTVLQHLNSKDTKVITIEDPVEYRVAGFSQIQIDPEKGITFPNAIRSCMRQDPDIMLVGEVRDEETAKLAVAAAETGHLVFTTLHTNNAIETLSRLDRLGVDRYQLQTLIRLVVAQRLIGVLCPHCKTARETKQHERDILARLGIACDPAQIVYEKRGCSHCNGVGTSGRTAVYSFFSPTDAIREMMGTDCPILDILKSAREGGFKTVMENALQFWLQGTASFSEVHSLED
jgi:type II secretory ATPase GspE/PulE/Tfp pilus assembly ATPase PilB-like protein